MNKIFGNAKELLYGFVDSIMILSPFADSVERMLAEHKLVYDKEKTFYILLIGAYGSLCYG